MNNENQNPPESPGIDSEHLKEAVDRVMQSGGQRGAGDPELFALEEKNLELRRQYAENPTAELEEEIDALRAEYNKKIQGSLDNKRDEPTT